MKIKTKLYLGFIFLFAVITGITLLGIISLNRIATDTQAILKANYETLQYVKNMQQALDRIEAGNKSGYEIFVTNLSMQEKNVTEEGEKEMTAHLRNQFQILVQSDSIPLIGPIRDILFKIQELNMNAIVKKMMKLSIRPIKRKCISR